MRSHVKGRVAERLAGDRKYVGAESVLRVRESRQGCMAARPGSALGSTMAGTALFEETSLAGQACRGFVCMKETRVATSSQNIVLPGSDSGFARDTKGETRV